VPNNPAAHATGYSNQKWLTGAEVAAAVRYLVSHVN
jgi:hypothetical protein